MRMVEDMELYCEGLRGLDKQMIETMKILVTARTHIISAQPLVESF